MTDERRAEMERLTETERKHQGWRMQRFTDDLQKARGGPYAPPDEEVEGGTAVLWRWDLEFLRSQEVERKYFDEPTRACLEAWVDDVKHRREDDLAGIDPERLVVTTAGFEDSPE